MPGTIHASAEQRQTALLRPEPLPCFFVLCAATGAQAQILAALKAAREAGNKVLVHCWGGECEVKAQHAA